LELRRFGVDGAEEDVKGDDGGEFVVGEGGEMSSGMSGMTCGAVVVVVIIFEPERRRELVKRRCCG